MASPKARTASSVSPAYQRGIPLGEPLPELPFLACHGVAVGDDDGDEQQEAGEQDAAHASS
jgi:hypothetical protein